MYGENNGAYFLMDDFGGKPAIFGNIPYICLIVHVYIFLNLPKSHLTTQPFLSCKLQF